MATMNTIRHAINIIIGLTETLRKVFLFHTIVLKLEKVLMEFYINMKLQIGDSLWTIHTGSTGLFKSSTLVI